MNAINGLSGFLKNFEISDAVIDVGAKLLGVPPQVVSIVKAGNDFLRNDFYNTVDIVGQLLGINGKQTASTQYNPSCDPLTSQKGYAANSELKTHLQTLKKHLGTLDTEGHSVFTAWAAKDNKFSYYNLASAANNPNCPQDLRDAARFFIGQPGLLLKLDTAAGIFPTDGVVGLADIEAMLDQVGGKSQPTLPPLPNITIPDCWGTRSVVDPKLAGYREALSGLTRNWDAFDSFVAAANGKIHQADFAAVRDNPNASLEMKKVAKFFTDNPEFFVRLDQSGQGNTQNLLVSRNDVENELRRVNEEISTPVSSKSSAATGGDVRSLVSDPSMSIEEKINLILNNVLDKIDSDLESTVDQLAAAQDKMGEKKEAAKDGKPYEGETKDARQVEKLNQKLQKLIEQKKAMSDLFSHMSSKFSEMSMTAISNIAKV